MALGSENSFIMLKNGFQLLLCEWTAALHALKGSETEREILLTYWERVRERKRERDGRREREDKGIKHKFVLAKLY